MRHRDGERVLEVAHVLPGWEWEVLVGGMGWTQNERPGEKVRFLPIG